MRVHKFNKKKPFRHHRPHRRNRHLGQPSQPAGQSDPSQAVAPVSLPELQDFQVLFLSTQSGLPDPQVAMNMSEPESKFKTVYAIIRYDTHYGDDIFPDAKIKVVKILYKETYVQQTAERLSRLDTDKKSIYFWQSANLYKSKALKKKPRIGTRKPYVKYKHLFPVFLFNTGDKSTPLPVGDKIKITKIFNAAEDAEREVKELTLANQNKDIEYFWDVAELEITSEEE